MKRVCVVVLSTHRAMFARLLPPTHLRVEGGGRIYLFYTSPGDDVAFRDVDGELLIESRSFPNLTVAHAWARKDAERR